MGNLQAKQQVTLEGKPLVGQPGPEIELLVREMIGRVADKWTMLILQIIRKFSDSVPPGRAAHSCDAAER